MPPGATSHSHHWRPGDLSSRTRQHRPAPAASTPQFSSLEPLGRPGRTSAPPRSARARVAPGALTRGCAQKLARQPDAARAAPRATTSMRNRAGRRQARGWGAGEALGPAPHPLADALQRVRRVGTEHHQAAQRLGCSGCCSPRLALPRPYRLPHSPDAAHERASSALQCSAKVRSAARCLTRVAHLA
jgi:hypothetical protein